MIYAIAIGSNFSSKFGNPTNSLKTVIRFLNKRNIQVIKKSKLYLSPPKDFTSAANIFTNAAILVKTSHNPYQLLLELKKIEALLGRYKYKKNTSRVCDLDIILMKPHKINIEKRIDFPCIIPHPEMCSRNFVLKPLLDICPNWIHPERNMSISSLIKSNYLRDKVYKASNIL